MIICENCQFKHDESKCPICGKPSPPKDNKVQQWNSTLKADPDKRPRQKKPLVTRKRDRKLADSMRDFARKAVGGDEMNARNVPCSNCGKLIREMKFENVSHKKTRGSRPDLAEDHDNMEILCSFTDYLGTDAVKDESCHTLWERKRFDRFHELKNKRTDQ